MDILIITRGKLPSPNSKGGAVEYLIQLILDENERNWHYNLHVLSIYNENAKEKSMKYKYTEFYYVHETFLYKIKRNFRYLVNKYTKHYIGNAFISEGIKLIKEIKSIDLVLIENAPEYIIPLKKVFPNTKYSLHLHNDFLNSAHRQYHQILKLYDFFLPISDYIRNQIDKAGQVCQCKIANGIELDRYQHCSKNDLKKLRLQYGIKENSLIFMSTSRIVPEKGIKELIQAFSLSLIEDAVLMILGGENYSSSKITPYVKECMDLAKISNARIIFTGYVDSRMIPLYCNMCSIGVIPSLWEEPFGLSALEFMSCGKPIITSDCDAFKEITEGQCGIMIKRGEGFVQEACKAMRIMANDEKLCNLYSNHSLAISKKYGSEQYLRNFNDFIRNKVSNNEN